MWRHGILRAAAVPLVAAQRGGTSGSCRAARTLLPAASCPTIDTPRTLFGFSFNPLGRLGRETREEPKAVKEARHAAIKAAAAEEAAKGGDEGFVELEIDPHGRIRYHNVIIGVMKGDKPQFFTDGVPEGVYMDAGEMVVGVDGAKVLKSDGTELGQVDCDGLPVVHGKYQDKWVDRFFAQELGGLDDTQVRDRLTSIAGDLDVESARELLFALHAQDPVMYSAKNLWEILDLQKSGVTQRHLESILQMKQLEHMARGRGLLTGDSVKLGVRAVAANIGNDPLTGEAAAEVADAAVEKELHARMAAGQLRDTRATLNDEYWMENDEDLVKQAAKPARPVVGEDTFGPQDFTEKIPANDRTAPARWVYKITEKSTDKGPDGVAFRRQRDGTVTPLTPTEKSAEARRRYRKKTW